MELVLNTYGISLNRDNEAFVVTTAEGKQRIPVSGISSIQISRGAQITSDAVMLAVENEIEIIFMDKSGSVIGRVWSPKYGSISTIRRGQLNFSFSEDAVIWIKEILRKKIENQQALLLMLMTDNETQKKTVSKNIQRLEDYRNKIKGISGQLVADIAPSIRGWEGVSSKIYFETLNLFIPEQYRFTARSQHPATDIVNAMLNYGYGLLYSKIESSMIKTGIDPYIGVLHRDDYNRPILVYDVIEIYRIWIDYVVYTLVMQNAVTEDYYSVREDGSYWLEPLGRRVLIQSVNDYLDENINIKSVIRSRQQQMFLYIQNLAQQFKNHN